MNADQIVHRPGAVAFNPVVSVTPNAFDPPDRTMPASEIPRFLKTGPHRDLIGTIREKFKKALAETGDLKAAKKAIDADKKNLPGFMFGGIFSNRGDKNLQNYSQLLCADIDRLEAERLHQAYDQLATDPYCLFVSVSPTGTGLKALFRTTGNASEHKLSVAAMVKYVLETHGLECDPKCSNMERLCFAMDNPTDWKSGARAFEPLPEAKTIAPARAFTGAPGVHPTTRRGIAERIFGEIEWEDETTGLCKCPGEHLHTTGNGERDCRVKIDGAPTIHCFHESCQSIVNGVNHELRSQIGKVELSGGPVVNSSKARFAAELLTKEPHGGASPEIIVLPSGPVSISESARAIFQRIAPKKSVFWRGGVLVQLFDVAGVQGLEVLKPEKFRSDVEKIGNLFAWRCAGKGEPALKPSKMSLDDAKAILAASESRDFLPPVASVLRCPVLTESKTGAVSVLGKGYHHELGGLLIVDGETPPAVPLAEAVEGLRWLIEEFHFQTGSDFSRALAAFITPGLRFGGFIRGNIPVDCAEADASQSGKGYRHEMVWTLYNEKAYFVTDKSGGVGSVDESLAAALLSGRPFICLDNFRGRMDSRKLESFLTCPALFPARTPGKQEALIDPKKFMLQISSNGLESTIDLANRASICRIRKRPSFQYRDTMGELQSRQSYFLGCVFAVISQWISVGKPRSQDTRHDFREWAQTLDWIVQSIFKGAPLLDGHQAAQQRTSNPELSFMRSVAIAVVDENRLGVPLSASDLVEICESHAIEIPGKPADDERARRQVGVLCKRIFHDSESLDLDGFTIDRSDRPYRKPSGDLDTTKAYTFAK